MVHAALWSALAVKEHETQWKVDWFGRLRLSQQPQTRECISTICLLVQPSLSSIPSIRIIHIKRLWATVLLTLLLVGATRQSVGSTEARQCGHVDLVMLGLALMVYDYVATWQFHTMSDLFERLAQLPMVPMVAWRAGAATWMGLGLGDILLATVFPLVMRKAFSRTAGLVAMMLGLVAIAVILALPLIWGVEASVFPVMIVLGPLMLVQYLFWQRRCEERTTWQYHAAAPLPGGAR